MLRPTVIVATALAAALTLSGCSVIEDLLPQDEQPTLNVFDEEASPAPSEDSIFDEPATEETPSDSQPSEETEDPAPAKPSATQTIEQLYDNMNALVLATENACLVENTLGSLTQVRISGTQTPPPPYEILYVTEIDAENDIRALAYYPTATTLNPEILTDYTPHICALSSFYPSTISELVGDDAALSSPAPADVRITRSGTSFVVTLPNANHILTMTGGVVTETQIVKPEETVTRTITHNLSKSQVDLFEQLYRIARSNENKEN